MLSKFERSICRKVLKEHFSNVAAEMDIAVRIVVTDMSISKNDTHGRCKLWAVSDPPATNDYLAKLPKIIRLHFKSHGLAITTIWAHNKFAGPYRMVEKEYISVDFDISPAPFFLDHVTRGIVPPPAGSGAGA